MRNDEHAIRGVSNPELHGGRPSDLRLNRPHPFRRKVLGIRTKLTVLTLVLIAVITTGSSVIVIRNMDRVLFDALVGRGASLAQGTATPAGYSILAKDRLALDNLAARAKNNQDDILYLAVLDQKGQVLAHSELKETGTQFIQASGPPLQQGDGYTVYRVDRNQQAAYEFQAPIMFADNLVGNIVVGLDAKSFYHAKYQARSHVVMISLLALLFGSIGTFLLSRLVTAPIERLSEGVRELTEGDHLVEVKVSSRDELGELTHSFNEMARVIIAQKHHLEANAKNLEEAYISTVRILAAALDARDNYTFGHSARVARLALMLGARLGLNEQEMKDLEMGCFLHDIGKIHVPDHILNKPTPLTRDEYLLVKCHPVQGAEILTLAESLHKYIPVVRHHHEWFNGQGYPHGLKGEEIHLFAQIVAIADSYDAMTSSRPYRKGCSRDQAVAEIMEFRGLQFNPELVDLFVEALGAFENDETLFSPGDPHATHVHLFTDPVAVARNAQRLRDIPRADREQESDAYNFIH